MLSKRSPGTWMSNTDRLSSAQSNTPKMYLFLCRFDHSLTFSHTMIGPLCIMPACYWSNYFSIITFSKYENRKTKTKQILARTCPKNGMYGHSTLYLHKRHISNGPNNIWPGLCHTFVKFIGIKIYYI